VIRARPELLGIGIDENTAIVVQGDNAQVIGASYVLIYDNQKMVGEEGLFYFLAPGDSFDLSTREATRPTRTREPVTSLEARPWPGG
jgi:cyanophycinase